MICTVCEEVLTQRKHVLSDKVDEDGTRIILFAHHRSTESLVQACSQGCHLCHPFWNQLSDAEQESLQALESAKEIPLVSTVVEEVSSGSIDDFLTSCIFLDERPGVRQKLRPRSGYKFSIFFNDKYVDLEKVNPRKRLAYGIYTLQPLSGNAGIPTCKHVNNDNTSCDEAWAVARGWVEDCTSKHAKCRTRSGSPAWYPTRLLQLDTSTVRLVFTTDEHVTGPYVTLSHCWGKAEPLQLTRSKLSDFMTGIKIENMPETFQDAISVTRKLGMHYIWIDSVCIMQDKDDPSDWVHEAALMHKVYSHSYCNISASAASDSSVGLFFARDARLLNKSIVTVNVEGFDDPMIQECELVDLLYWQHEVSHCTINRRGWVLQERLLAPRVLHFGRHQLLWECREQDACEKYPDGLPEILKLNMNTNFKALDPNAYISKLVSQGRSDEVTTDEAMYRVWGNIVEAYSESLLTVSTDKLIAISGLAKDVAHILQDEYVAGMWRKYLASELLWHVRDGRKIDGTPSERPKQYRAPSWSWASVDGMVSPGTTTYQNSLISVENVHLEYATSDKTGLLTGGYLDLRGRLKPFTIAPHVGITPRLRLQVQGKFVHESDDLPEWKQTGPHIDLDVLQDSFDAENEAAVLFYVCAQGAPKEVDYLAILLLLLVDAEQGIYRRIGLASAITEKECEILNYTPVDEDKIPCRFYQNGEHIFRAI